MTAVRETAGPFDLLTYRRGLDARADPVSVYIEGDGRAWRNRRPPRDPTPPRPLGLRLAARDPSAAVLWIGRPCMYLEPPAAKRCDIRWWTSHRYSPEVVDALLVVVRRNVQPAQSVVLVGHSGGGALAALLAARLVERPGPALDGLITVAAPLDLPDWTQRFEMTPLSGSVDPMSVAAALAPVPQRHLAGGRDDIVPTDVVRRFVRAIPVPHRARLEVYPDHGHGCCWEDSWQLLRARPPP